MSLSTRGLTALVVTLVVASAVPAQHLEKSGVGGLDLFYASSPGGTSQLFATALTAGLAPIPLGAPVAGVPSRWAHRRRTLGALETRMQWLDVGAIVCPLGDAAGNGALHLVDFRLGLAPITSVVIPTANPAGYDLADFPSLGFLFVCEDDGAGTTLRGYSYATPGTLTPLTPATLALPGRPAAYCNRMGIDEAAGELHVPTAAGIQIVDVAGANDMSLGPFISTAPRVPTTNPVSFDRNGTTTWVVGTGAFMGVNNAVDGGFACWNSTGASESGTFGLIPNLSPPRPYVPAAGTHELAVVGNGVDTWAYYLLRDPSPTASFIRPSAVGVVRFLGSSAAAVSTIVCPQEMGEPFSIPTVHGTRVAIESSMGPPFNNQPPGGGEPISILYSPLDPIGAGSIDGVLAVPDPLGGRVSTKGMDRPIWSRDGTRVVAATSHFPGAPNPGIPGLEVLDVPATIPVDLFTGPHTVVPNLFSPNRSIILPSIYDPRDPAADFAGLSFVGNVFADGMASALLAPFGEIGQFQPESQVFVQDPDIPNFRSILPPSFEDATGSLTPVPAHFGARRTTFNRIPGFGLDGLVMNAAIDDEILVQTTGFNFLAQVGIHPAPAPALRIPLPAGWATTTEFLSL